MARFRWFFAAVMVVTFFSAADFFGANFFAAALAQETVVFEDPLDGSLQSGWEWRRENPDAHRFNEGGLEIEAEPFADNEAKNVLVRPFPNRSKGIFRIETEVTCVAAPTNQYQQGGLYWLQDGQVAFKLVHEFVDGQTYIFPGKIPVSAKTVRLRIISSGDDIIAEFCGDGESSYRRVYEGKIAKSDRDEIGVQCWHGPQKSDSPQRYRFKKFRIIQAGE